MLCSNGDDLELFDTQPAVNEWSSNVQRRPGFRRNKATSTSSTFIEADDYETDSDSNSETESSDNDFCDDIIVMSD